MRRNWAASAGSVVAPRAQRKACMAPAARRALDQTLAASCVRRVHMSRRTDMSTCSRLRPMSMSCQPSSWRIVSSATQAMTAQDWRRWVREAVGRMRATQPVRTSFQVVLRGSQTSGGTVSRTRRAASRALRREAETDPGQSGSSLSRARRPGVVRHSSSAGRPRTARIEAAETSRSAVGSSTMSWRWTSRRRQVSSARWT